MQTAKFVVLFLIWSAKTKSSVTVKMLNSYKVVTKQKGVRIMRQYHETERGRYNETVADYNRKIKRFPTVIIAGMMGFDERAYFEAADGAETAPKVDLTNP